MPEETRGIRCGYVVTTTDANGKAVEIETPIASHGWEAVTVISDKNGGYIVRNDEPRTTVTLKRQEDKSAVLWSKLTKYGYCSKNRPSAALQK